MLPANQGQIIWLFFLKGVKFISVNLLEFKTAYTHYRILWRMLLLGRLKEKGIYWYTGKDTIQCLWSSLHLNPSSRCSLLEVWQGPLDSKDQRKAFFFLTGPNCSERPNRMKSWSQARSEVSFSTERRISTGTESENELLRQRSVWKSICKRKGTKWRECKYLTKMS